MLLPVLKSGSRRLSSLLNDVTWEATHLLAEMMSKEVADVISYNSSMKACEHAWPQALHVCLGRLSCIGL